MPENQLKRARHVYVVRRPIRLAEPVFIPPDVVIVDASLDEEKAREAISEKLSKCLRVDRDRLSEICGIEFLV